jgi:hypothetical protein
MGHIFYFPSEGRHSWGFFTTPEKSNGFGRGWTPRTGVTEASMLTARPPKLLWCHGVTYSLLTASPALGSIGVSFLLVTKLVHLKSYSSLCSVEFKNAWSWPPVIHVGHLQSFVFAYAQTCLTLLLNVSTNEICVTVAKRNIECEIKVRDTVIEQAPNFYYLWVEISGKTDLKQGVRIQTTNAARMSGCLYNLMWRNKHVNGM